MRAAAWILLYLVLSTAPLLALLAGTEAPGRGFAWDFAIALGFAGAVMMGVQFLLTARFRRATAPFGIDIIYYFHRYAALVVMSAVFAHVGIILAEEPAYLAFLNPLAAPRHMTAGTVSLLALSAVMATSLLRKQLGIHYDAWRLVHVLLAIVAVAAALVHVDGVAYYTAQGSLRMLWPVMAVAWAGVVVYVRVVRPLIVRLDPYRVVEVRAERGDAWTLALERERGDAVRFEPGQFAWLSLRSGPPAMHDHPFSISSSASRRDRLEFTIKELGDFTRTVSSIRVGEPAYVDGPYGAFTIDRHDSPAFVLIGGGIGIAPLMSMLRTLADRGDRRPCLLVYGYRRWERLTFREELERLAECMPLRVVYVLEEPPQDWKGASGLITREILERELPADRNGAEYFVCGPEAMIHSVESSLAQLGVPLARVHSELFDLV